MGCLFLLPQIYVRTGIFHGTECLCPVRDTQHVAHSNPKWEELVEFDMFIPDMPRSARLCVSICAVSQRKKREVSGPDALSICVSSVSVSLVRRKSCYLVGSLALAVLRSRRLDALTSSCREDDFTCRSS